MSRSGWVSKLAVVGWLAAFQFCLAQAPSGQGVSDEPSTVEKQAEQKADYERGRSSRPSVPVTIVETPEQAYDSKERETKSDQHEFDDLAAQRKAADAADRSADAAERQIVPTWVQVGLATVGTIALLVSLAMTWAALGIAKNTAKQQLRAYLSPENFRFIDGLTFLPAKFEIPISNKGQTPAKDININAVFRIEVEGEPLEGFPVVRIAESFGTLNPGTTLTVEGAAARKMTEAERQRFHDGEIVFYLDGTGTFKDVFDNPHELSFKWNHRWTRTDNTISQSSKCLENDST